MKNLRNICALMILSFAFYSCDSEVTIDDPQTETIQDINSKTGEEGNEPDDRGGD